MNALSVALLVPQTVQSVTGQQVHMYGLCNMAQLELLESMARQCSSQPATVTRTNTPSKVWDAVKGAGSKSYGAACTAASCTADACSNVSVTYSTAKQYVAGNGAAGITGIAGKGAAAVGAIGNGVVTVGKGVFALPSMVLGAPRAVCDQVKHDAQLTKDCVVSAKNWLTGKKVDQVQACKLAFDLHVADATGELTQADDMSDTDTCSDISEFETLEKKKKKCDKKRTLENMIDAAAE